MLPLLYALICRVPFNKFITAFISAPNDVESCKMHSEDEKAGLEKNRKRTVKTQAQVQELEKFYNGNFLILLTTFCC